MYKEKIMFMPFSFHFANPVCRPSKRRSSQLIINDSDTIISGTPGPQGPQGEPGPRGSVCSNKVTISDDYTTKEDDWYIGVNATKPITITLNPKSCYLVIKLEMGPPIGNRKVTIVSSDLIDSKSSIVLTKPYESIVLISGSGWNIIK